MGNRLIPHAEMAKVLEKHLVKLIAKSPKAAAAFVYDLGTAIGGFPSSKAERDRYIKTASRKLCRK